MTVRAGWLVLGLAACGGTTGVVDVTLVTAPGSTVMDGVQTLELTLTNPMQTQTATRQGSGFTIELELDAVATSGALIVQGLDATGALVATGASPPFPVDALTASIAIYMAAPNSVAAAPVELDPARDQLAVGSLSYGVLLAGGRDATLAPSDAVAIYNAFDHTETAGVALPAPRAGLALGVAGGTYAYLFGGDDASGAPQANAWYFDTSVAPAGSYADFGDKTGFERAGQNLVAVDADDFVLTGTPAAELSALDGALVARTDVASLPAAAAAAIGSDGVTAAIFDASAGLTRYRDDADAFDTLAAPAGVARDGATVAALSGGTVGVFCGGPDAATIDVASGAVATVPGVPSDDRASGCAVAATDRFVVIAGGTLAAGGVATTAEIYDLATLARVATAPLVVPRTGATAVALPNGQVLIAGGDDATGAPIATLELFTPAPDLAP